MSCQGTVTEGDHVIFKTDDKTKVFQVSKNRKIFFEKTKLNGREIVGQPYGTLFEIQQGKLVVVTPTENGAEASVTAGSGKDNRDLVASGGNQKLTQDEIMKMKETGVSGQDIVGKLVEQSETFKTKTEFSQEKYIKKKKKKHMSVFRILRPCSRLLLDTFRHTPSKISNLRADSLSQLLCYSNVMSGATVAVVETCQGIVLGSVMERLGGNGQVVHLYPGSDMIRQVVNQFNFTEDLTKTLHEFPLNKLASLENGTLLPQAESSLSAATNITDSENTAANQAIKSEKDTPSENITDDLITMTDKHSKAEDENVDGDSDKDDDDGGDKEGDDEKDPGTDEKEQAEIKSKGKQKKRPRLSAAEQEAKKQQRMERTLQAASILKQKNLDSLIIATKFDPAAILLRLLPYVAPSCPVVVFSQHKEPLLECFTKVKESGSGVQLKLSESWYREYQVLPSRTHPLMSMSGTGGYLLSFFKVTSQLQKQN